MFEFVHNVQTIKHVDSANEKSGKFTQSVEWWRKFAIRLGGELVPDRAEKTRMLQIFLDWERIAKAIDRATRAHGTERQIQGRPQYVRLMYSETRTLYTTTERCPCYDVREWQCK